MSTVSGTLNFGIHVGGAQYPSPLTITSTGRIAGQASNSYGGAGVVAVTLYDGVSLLNDGAIVGGAGALGNFVVGGGAGAAGAAGGVDASLVNHGTISGGAGGNAVASDGGGGGAGVTLGANSSLVNYGAISGGAGGYGAPFYDGGGGGAGVALGANSSLLNDGTIAGGAGGSSHYTHGGGGAGVTLGDSASLLNTGAIFGGASGYGGSGGGAGVAAGTAVNVVNDGTIVGGAGSAEGTGGLHYGGAIGGAGVAAGDGSSLVNHGTIFGGAGGSESFFGGGGGGAGVALGGDSSLSNDGTITGGAGGAGGPFYDGGAGGAGVALGDGASLVNAGAIFGGGGGEGGAAGGGGGAGVAAGTAVSMVNDRTIVGGAGGFGVTRRGGAGGAGVAAGDGSSLVNHGTIVGGAGGYGPSYYGGAGGAGVSLGSGSSVVNDGTISGGAGGNGLFAAGAAGDGVVISGRGVVTNQAGGLIAGGTGVSLTAGGTVIDAGTITGSSGTAVAFGGTAGHDLLKLYPGAVLTGIATAGGSGNVLELASAASAGTISGIGYSFLGFGTVTVDGNAQWVIAGTNTLASSTTLADSGTLTIKGSLFAAGSVGITKARGLQMATGYLNNSGAITNTITSGIAVYARSGTTNNVVVNTGTLSGTGASGMGIRLGGSGTITNAGLIAGNAASGFGIYAAVGATITNQAGGRITGYVGVGGSSIQLSNAGTIGSVGMATKAGVYLLSGSVTNLSGGLIAGYVGVLSSPLGSSVTIQNAGTIAGSSTSGLGIDLGAGGRVTNQAGGTISGFYGLIIAGAAGTLVNAGRIASYSTRAPGAYLGAGGTVINQASGTISGATGVRMERGGTVIDAGTIACNGTAVSFGGTAGHDLLKLYPGAVLTGIATAAGNGNVLELASAAGTGTIRGIGYSFLGFGTVTVDSGAQWAIAGSNTIGAAATLVDSGTATVTGTLANAGAISAGTEGLRLAAGADLVNQAGGVITGTGSGQAVHGLPSGSVSVTNDGTISESGSLGIGVYLDCGGSLANGVNGAISGFDGVEIFGTGTVDNKGSITGYGFVGLNIDAGSVTNEAGGVITGFNGVALNDTQAQVAGGSVTLVNHGLISGTGDGLGIGAYSVATNEADGTITGGQDAVFIDGTAASSGILVNHGTISSAASGVVADGTVINDGVISGATVGASLLLGFVTNDVGGVITGGQAAVVGYGISTISNFGTIQALASAGLGIDLLAGGTVIDGGLIEGGGTAVAFGTAGNSLLKLYPGAVLTGIATAGGSGNELELANAGSAGTISGIGSSFVGFGTISVDSGAQWMFAGSNTIGATTTLVATGHATVTGTGTMTNAGSIDGGAGGLRLDAGADLVNQASGVIAGTTTFGSAVYGLSSGAVSVTNAGTISQSGTAGAGVYLAGGGSVTNAAGGMISASSAVLIDGTGTVDNHGNIAGVSVGVEIQAGFVTNAAGGTISGSGGVNLNVSRAPLAGGSGTLVNHGLISVTDIGVLVGVYSVATNAADGTISSGNEGVLVEGTGASIGTLVNQGIVSGTISGVAAFGGSIVDEAGGVISGDTYGVAGSGAGVTVTNFGTIQGTGRSAVGIDMLEGGTIIDGGAISGAGGTAVKFLGTSANLLVLEHGYHLTGGIDGSASATNTLELLGTGSVNAVTADYNGLTLTNFGTVAFAPGANNFATLTITDTTALPGTITGFTGRHDAIDLTQLSDASHDASYTFSASSHILTVTGDNGSVRLQLGIGAYSNGFAVTNDGHGGTEITGGGHPAPVISSIAASGPGITDGSGDLRAGKTVTLKVTFDQVVTVNTHGGTPSLTLNDGGTATYTGGSGTRTLIFTYTVAAGQNIADLAVTGLSLHGSTIQNGFGNPADLSGAATNPAGTLQIDTTPPTVTPVTATALEDSKATPIGITVPAGQGGFTIRIAGLPNDGTVFLADRKTKVTVGETLTLAQLEGLTFRPTLNQHDRTSALTYTLTDAAGNVTIGTATLKIDVDNGLVYVTPTTLAGKSYDGGGNHKLIVQGSGAADLAGVSGFTEIVLTGALSVSLANGNLTGVRPPDLVVTAQAANTEIDLSGVTGANDRVLIHVTAAQLGTDTIVGGGGGSDAILIAGSGTASLAGVTGIGNIDLRGAATIALSDGAHNNFAGVSGRRIAVTAEVGHVTIDDSAVTKAADGVVIFADATDLASDKITGSASGNDVLHVQGSGRVDLSGVSGIANFTFAGGDTVKFTNADFTGTSGLIVVTDLGGGNTIDGSAITGNHNLIVHGAAGDTLTGGGGSNFLVAGGGAEKLIGGSGDTGFALTSATGKATIQRFSAAGDQIVFSDAAFNLGIDDGKGSGTPEQLAARVFSANSSGSFASAQNRFAYDSATGVLYYSPDGKNADKVSVAVLSGHPTLKAQDLFFFG